MNKKINRSVIILLIFLFGCGLSQTSMHPISEENETLSEKYRKIEFAAGIVYAIQQAGISNDLTKIAEKRYFEAKKLENTNITEAYLKAEECIKIYKTALPVIKSPKDNLSDMENDGDQNIEKYKNNVVKLISEFSNSLRSYGFGFVVGERDEKLYIVTAQHLVSSNNPDSELKNIQVVFYTDQGKSHLATRLNLTINNLDVSLIEVKKPERYVWKKCYDTVAKRKDHVWFIGRRQDWYIPIDPGRIIEESSHLTNFYVVKTDEVEPGTSGAPLLTKNGIAGMITDDGGNNISAIDIKAIKDAVVKKWNYPWEDECQSKVKN